MAQWEYRRIHLIDIPPKSDEIDFLNEAGGEGWELVGMTSNNVAYLKRPIEPAAVQAEQPVPRTTRRKVASAVK